jgi:hypothetical protein
LTGNGWSSLIIGEFKAVVVGFSDTVVVVAANVLDEVEVGGSTNGANVSLPDESNDAHEVNVSRETVSQRFISSAF